MVVCESCRETRFSQVVGPARSIPKAVETPLNKKTRIEPEIKRSDAPIPDRDIQLVLLLSHHYKVISMQLTPLQCFADSPHFLFVNSESLTRFAGYDELIDGASRPDWVDSPCQPANFAPRRLAMKSNPRVLLLFVFALASTAVHAQYGATPIKHVVVIFQENRTPDNLFQG